MNPIVSPCDQRDGDVRGGVPLNGGVTQGAIFMLSRISIFALAVLTTIGSMFLAGINMADARGTVRCGGYWGRPCYADSVRQPAGSEILKRRKVDPTTLPPRLRRK